MAVVLTLGLLYWHRPAGQFFYPRCSFHAMTGWWCPGCGGLRSVHELLHGHGLAAVRCNALFVVGAPAWVVWVWWRRRTGREVLSPRLFWILFGVVVAFGILRNLPGVPFSWLAP